MRFDNSLLMPKIRSHLLTYAALACLAMVSGCTTPNLFSGGLLGMGRSSSEDADGLDTDRQELLPKRLRGPVSSPQRSCKRVGTSSKPLRFTKKAAATIRR